jgi:hypothetical protein
MIKKTIILFVLAVAFVGQMPANAPTIIWPDRPTLAIYLFIQADLI